MATKNETSVPALSGLGTLLGQVEEAVNNVISDRVEKSMDEINKKIAEAKKYAPVTVIKGTEKHVVEGLKHKQLDTLIKLVGSDLNVLIVGMAGAGKTKSAQQVSEALGLDFYCQSVGSQTSKSDLLGYMDANGKYVSTAFRKAYEKGGVFVMDEIDAGNSNVLIVLNSALSNGVCSFPDKMVNKSENFRFIATANTYGTGADRTYVGRNQLDGATLDRFVTLEWEVDEALEESMVNGLPHGKAWCETVKSIRKDIKNRGVRAIISPRATLKGAVCLEAGMKPVEVVKMVLLPLVPSDEQEKTKSNAIGNYDIFIKEYPANGKKGKNEPIEGEVVDPAVDTEFQMEF